MADEIIEVKHEKVKKPPRVKTYEEYRGQLRKLKGFTAEYIPDYSEFDKVAKERYLQKYGTMIKEQEEKCKQAEIEKVEITENEVGVWQNQVEAEKAQGLFTSYKEGKNFTEPSDLENLKMLVDAEIKKYRLQRNPNSSIRETVEISNLIIELKKKIGLLGEESSDGVAERIKSLMKKAQEWRNKNRVAFEIRCGHCGKENLLRIKTDCYESFKHPFYTDRVLCNQHLWDLYKEGKITKLDLAKVLFADKAKENIFYIDWLEQKIYSLKDENAIQGNNPIGA